MNDTEMKSGIMRLLLIAASCVIVVAGMKAATGILVPFLLAVFIAIVTAPLFIWMQRKGIPAAVALLLMIAILVAAGALGVGLVRQSLTDFSTNLPSYQSRLEQQTTQLWEWLEAKGIDAPDEVVSDALNPQTAMRYLGSLAGTLSSTLSNVFLVLLVVVFILLEAAALPAKVRALPGMTQSAYDKIETAVDKVRQYVSLKTAVSLLTGVLVTIWLALLGVDSPILFGLLAFFLNYIPNIGSVIAAIPGVLLAFIEFGLGRAGVVAGGYVVINVVVGNVVEPRLMGQKLGLSPLVILLSLILWSWVLGPMGMLLSIPLTMVAKIAMEGAEETRWLAVLMGPASAEPVQSAQEETGPGPDANREDVDETPAPHDDQH